MTAHVNIQVNDITRMTVRVDISLCKTLKDRFDTILAMIHDVYHVHDDSKIESIYFFEEVEE